MNILLISGHGNGDVGAVSGSRQEYKYTREVTSLLKKELDKYANVTIYPTSRNAYKDVINGTFAVNITKFDYVLEIHFNAFNGKAYGTEIFVTSRETGIGVEQEIMEHLSDDFKLRDNDAVFDGVKVTDFAVINYCKGKGVSAALLEMCFIDNDSDMKIYEERKSELMNDIAMGIVEGFGLVKGEPEVKPVPKPPVTTKTNEELADEVIKGLWGTGANRKTRLENAGYDYDAVQAIVNEKLGGSTTPTKSLNTWAKEVINGKHGNGHATREASLKKAGCQYSYKQVRAEVNRILA